MDDDVRYRLYNVFVMVRGRTIVFWEVQCGVGRSCLLRGGLPGVEGGPIWSA